MIDDKEERRVTKTNHPKIVKVVEYGFTTYVFKPFCRICGERLEYCEWAETFDEAKDRIHGETCWNCSCLGDFENALIALRQGIPLTDGDCRYTKAFVKHVHFFEETDLPWWEFIIEEWDEFEQETMECFGDEESVCECPLGV